MAKKLIRLTEGDLHRIVKESVQRILREAHGKMTIEEILQDISPNSFRYFDIDDVEANGNSGRGYRFSFSNNGIEVMWCPIAREHDWDSGGVSYFNNNDPNFDKLLSLLKNYVINNIEDNGGDLDEIDFNEYWG